jgi:hypothetical protein
MIGPKFVVLSDKLPSDNTQLSGELTKLMTFGSDREVLSPPSKWTNGKRPILNQPTHSWFNSMLVETVKSMVSTTSVPFSSETASKPDQSIRLSELDGLKSRVTQDKLLMLLTVPTVSSIMPMNLVTLNSSITPML